MSEIEITAADREAAAITITDDGSHADYMMIDAILTGRMDGSPLVKAFAQARILVRSAALEEAAQAADAIACECKRDAMLWALGSSIATAIRQLSHHKEG